MIQLGSDRATVWHDANRDPYATIPLVSGGFDNLPIRGKRFREWLAGEWYRIRKRVAPKEALDRAIETLAARAVYDGDKLETAKRIGHTLGTIWVDLADEARRIVRVTAEGWEIVMDEDCRVRFLRPEGMRAMPEPVRGATLNGLRRLLSLVDDGARIVEAFLMGAFMPSYGAFPILIVTREQGSGKSFGCRVIRGIVDPSKLDLCRAPRDEGGLGAARNSGFVLAFDNLSTINA